MSAFEVRSALWRRGFIVLFLFVSVRSGGSTDGGAEEGVGQSADCEASSCGSVLAGPDSTAAVGRDTRSAEGVGNESLRDKSDHTKIGVSKGSSLSGDLRRSLRPPTECNARPVEEHFTNFGLEALLDDPCPVVLAFFSGSSLLAQTEKLALMELQLAASFWNVSYVKVDADRLGIRSFLQWEISFLPMFIVIKRASVNGGIREWVRWPDRTAANPYDYQLASAFVSRVTGIPIGNYSRRDVGPLAFSIRGSPKWSRQKLAFSWFLVIAAGLHYQCRQRSGDSG
jgi:hypothetical protein